MSRPAVDRQLKESLQVSSKVNCDAAGRDTKSFLTMDGGVNENFLTTLTNYYFCHNI